MKKAVIVIIAVLLLVSIVPCLAACDEKETEPTSTPTPTPTPAPKPTETLGFTEKDNPYLVLLDDFTGTDLDTKLWNVYGPNELDEPHVRRGAYWDPRQVIVQNDTLIIRTQVREDGYYYTGAIDTDGKYDGGYGYYEARCKLPKASGLWSAFWLMSHDMRNADVTVSSAEIDIMESPYYRNDLYDYQINVHVGNYADDYIAFSKSYPGQNMFNYSKVTGDNEGTIYDDWHTFGLDWTKDYYRFYIDRKLVCEITDKKFISPLKDFLFLSVEVDGNAKTIEDDGLSITVPDAHPELFGAASLIDSNTAENFPCDFMVDWVAVFSQRPF